MERKTSSLIVSYGGHGGGQAGAQLRSVLEFIRMELAAPNVELTLPRDSYGEDWRLVDADPIVASHENEIRSAAQVLGTLARSNAAESVPVGV